MLLSASTAPSVKDKRFVFQEACCYNTHCNETSTCVHVLRHVHVTCKCNYINVHVKLVQNAYILRSPATSIGTYMCTVAKL